MGKHSTTTRRCVLCTKTQHISRFKITKGQKIPSKQHRYVCIYCTETTYKKLRGNALRRGYKFELTEEEFEEIRRNPCLYCGFGNVSGIDRYINTDHYHKQNCVPCCLKCNKFKGKMNGDDFIDLCRTIAYQ